MPKRRRSPAGRRILEEVVGRRRIDGVSVERPGRPMYQTPTPGGDRRRRRRRDLFRTDVLLRRGAPMDRPQTSRPDRTPEPRPRSRRRGVRTSTETTRWPRDSASAASTRCSTSASAAARRDASCTTGSATRMPNGPPAAPPPPWSRRMTDNRSGFDRPVRDFLTWTRIEAGLAPATREAYARDLQELATFLRGRGFDGPAEVGPNDLAEHLQYLGRERGLQPSSITRHLATGSSSGG